MELEVELIEDIRNEAMKTFRCSSEALDVKREKEESFVARRALVFSLSRLFPFRTRPPSSQ